MCAISSLTSSRSLSHLLTSSCSGRRHIGHCTSASGAFVNVVVRLKAEKFRPVLARSHFSIVSSSRSHWLSINLLSERNNNNVSL